MKFNLNKLIFISIILATILIAQTLSIQRKHRSIKKKIGIQQHHKKNINASVVEKEKELSSSLNNLDQRQQQESGCQNKKHSPSTTINIKTDKVTLPTTPKGLDLSNHYGADPKQSPYGPQPTLLKQEAIITQANGTKIKTIITKIIHTSINPSGCDISSFANFQLCLELNDCDICSAAPQCGWCEATKRCLPGNMKAAACPGACSVSGWNFHASTCRNIIKSGFLKMSHDASKIINPEITDPKAKVDTVITHEAVVRTPVLLGHRKYKTQITRLNQDGQIVGKSEVDVLKPIVGEIHQVMNVDTHHQQYIDIKSGRRLDKPEPEIFHGTDEY